MFFIKSIFLYAMPLIMGEWKLFIEKKKATVFFNSIDNHGRFDCAISGMPFQGDRPMLGEGFWGEAARQICFSTFWMMDNTPNDQKFLNFFFKWKSNRRTSKSRRKTNR